MRRAEAAKGDATPAERALIEAQRERFSDPPTTASPANQMTEQSLAQPADRSPLDRAYADAMRAVWHANRSDADIGALYAESLMNLRPWDLWTADGQPQPGTEEIIATLDEVRKLNPNHPGALHLYVHAIEASPHPERAKDAADRLRTLVPASGHLVHMPSHIDVLTGEWKLAADQNERSIKIDADYRKLSPQQGFYRLYVGHNLHMLAFAAMMEGRSAIALQAARDLVRGVPVEFGRDQSAIVDPFMCAPYDVMKRFGLWDELLREPAPFDYWPITTAMWRFSRGVAYAARGDVQRAGEERGEFERAVRRVPPDALMMINRAHDTLAIAGHMLDGEIAYRRGDTDEAVRHLRAGVEQEARQRYMEPPEWIPPVRHTLGAILLQAGRHAEAEQVYRDDLAKWPENGWSLYGLSQSLKQQERLAEASDVERRFQKAWKRADTKIGSSCLCVKTDERGRASN